MPGKRLTTKEIIERAKEKHGEKYDYSKTNYINSDIKIEIICRIHGSFFQISIDHLRGQGCPICGEIKRSNNRIND